MFYPLHSQLIMTNTASKRSRRTLLAGTRLPESFPCKFDAEQWPQEAAVYSPWYSGASYTATGFDWKNGVQPSPGNPFANPASYKGHTSSNGPNFIMYLTTKYNQSMIQTYNFAWSGSPVPGMVGQIEDAFVPLYTGGAKFAINDTVRHVLRDQRPQSLGRRGHLS